MAPRSMDDVQRAMKALEARTEKAPASMAIFMADVLKGRVRRELVSDWVDAYFRFHEDMTAAVGKNWVDQVAIADDEGPPTP